MSVWRTLDAFSYRSEIRRFESRKTAANRAQSIPRESGARFKRSAGHFETTALRFCAANAAWCFPEQKKAITICEEVFLEPSWSESPRNDCKATLLRIVEDIHERHQWHDGLRAHQREVLLASEDSWGRRVRVATISEHVADNIRKMSHDSSRRKKEGVVVRRRVVHETVVMSQRHVSRSGNE